MQKTSYGMRISYRSSDVCPSCLPEQACELGGSGFGRTGNVLGWIRRGGVVCHYPIKRVTGPIRKREMQASAKRSNGRHYAAARQTGGLGPGRGDAVVAERGHAGISHGGEGHLMSRTLQIGRAHVRTTVTNEQLVCCLLLEKKPASRHRKS